MKKPFVLLRDSIEFTLSWMVPIFIIFYLLVRANEVWAFWEIPKLIYTADHFISDCVEFALLLILWGIAFIPRIIDFIKRKYE
jgi:hypothetical protein